MKFANVIHALYCEPWLIAPEMHLKLCEIVQGHICGDAHLAGGMAAQFADADGAVILVRVVDSIAIIGVDGVLGKRVGDLEKSSGVVDVDDLENAIEEALEDEGIEGILLDVSSPGGTVTGVPELAEFIAQATKPVAAHTDTQMASAAMYISAGVDIIMATASAWVGSIGVYSSFIDKSRAFELAGLKSELFTSGKFKGMGQPGLPLSEDQKELLQSRVDVMAGQFVAFVQEHRGNLPESLFEGQAIEPGLAVETGLIDKIGSLQDALSELRSLIDIGK